MSEKTPQSKKATRVGVLLTVAALFIILAGMREAQEILLPFLIAVFLAVVSSPAVFWMTAKRVPRALAVLLVVAAMVGVGTGLAALIGTSVNNFSRSIPTYQSRLQEEISALFCLVGWVWGRPVPRCAARLCGPGSCDGLGLQSTHRPRGRLTNAFLILLTVVFILLEVSSFPGKLRVATGEAKLVFPHFTKFTDSVKGYLGDQDCGQFGSWRPGHILVWVMGVDFPLLWGLLAFLLNYIPNIGSIIAAVPAVLLAFIQFGFGTAMIVTIGYLMLNVVLGNIIEPRFMGRGLGLSTLVVFLSLIFWGWLWGTVGMLLSVPLTMTVKIALESNERTRWLAVLLGPPVSELVPQAEGSGE